MGHTRMATQGSAGKNRNNHPFEGHSGSSSFALAHNGVLYNDRILRRELKLPATAIETDSYAAVQLLERQKALTPDSLDATSVEMPRRSHLSTEPTMPVSPARSLSSSFDRVRMSFTRLVRRWDSS